MSDNNGPLFCNQDELAIINELIFYFDSNS